MSVWSRSGTRAILQIVIPAKAGIQHFTAAIVMAIATQLCAISAVVFSFLESETRIAA
jgi:hypothetical protein